MVKEEVMGREEKKRVVRYMPIRAVKELQMAESEKKMR